MKKGRAVFRAETSRAARGEAEERSGRGGSKALTAGWTGDGEMAELGGGHPVSLVDHV